MAARRTSIRIVTATPITAATLLCAKAEGKPLGRPAALTAHQQEQVRERIAAGETVSAIARDMGTSRQTIMRARDAQLT